MACITLMTKAIGAFGCRSRTVATSSFNPVIRAAQVDLFSRRLLATFIKTTYPSTHQGHLLVIHSPPHQQLHKKKTTAAVNIKMEFAGDKDYIFKQFLDYKSYTYTYLLVDCKSNDAVLIDPVYELVDRDVQAIKDLGINLKYAVNTHVHADHITGSGEIKKRLATCQSMIAESSNAQADVKLKEGDLIQFGSQQLEVRSTPGHTDGCLSFVWHDKKSVFTGDAVLIRGCGRTDFQQGDPGRLFDSVHNKIFSLPKSYTIYPAHDYTGQTSSTVAEELKLNSRLTKSKDEFINIMNNLNLPYPRQIDKALPANLKCGIFDEPPQ